MLDKHDDLRFAGYVRGLGKRHPEDEDKLEGVVERCDALV